MTASHWLFYSAEIIYGTGATWEEARKDAAASCANGGEDIGELGTMRCTKALHDLVGQGGLADWRVVDGVACTVDES